MASLLRAALEAVTPAQKEDEMVFYGRIKHLSDLKKADSMESQEQYQIRIDQTEGNVSKGSIRCRMTTPQDGAVFYTLTVKTPAANDQMASNIETNSEANSVTFEQFKMLASEGMKKDRYSFKIDDEHKWEVDAFPSSNGTYHEWVKIDLEMKNVFNVPDFPFEMDEVILAQHGKRTPEEEAKIDILYKTVFTVPNPYKK